MFLTKNFSSLIKRINKYIKMSKTLILFVQSSNQNRKNIGRLGGTGQRVLRYYIKDH